MHVMGKLQPHIKRRGVVSAGERELVEVPVEFYRTASR
jgi:putative protease